MQIATKAMSVNNDRLDDKNTNNNRPFSLFFWSREITIGTGVWFVGVWNQFYQRNTPTSINQQGQVLREGHLY